MELTQEQQAEWNAMVAESEGSTNAPAAETPQPQQTQETAAETTTQETTAAAGAATEATTAAVEPAETPKAKTTEELLTEMLSRFDKLEGRTRNVEGHIGGLTRSQKEMRETMQQAASAAAAATKDAPTQAQVKEAIADPAEWETLKKDFPEWATATEKFLDAKLSQRGSATPAVDPEAIDKIVAERVKGVTADVRKEIIDTALEAVFPGWTAEVKTDAFGKWLDAQSAEVKALAESSQVGDAAKMLRLYDEAKKASPVTAILDKRQQKLANAAAAPRGVRPAAVKAPEDMSPQELWEYEAQQRAKRKAAS